MSQNVAPLANLIDQFERMPGIGRKSAQRLAYYILNLEKDAAKAFADNILLAHDKIRHCDICCDLTDRDVCTVCGNAARDNSIVCVVEDSRDVAAIERTHEYKGAYHVLHGVISPMNNIGPEDITVKALISRLGSDEVKEVIMATNPTVEGEATAMYISRLIKPFGLIVTRLAYGVPVGSDLEYADEVTLCKALEGRREI